MPKKRFQHQTARDRAAGSRRMWRGCRLALAGRPQGVLLRHVGACPLMRSARVYRLLSSQQEDRLPLATCDDAIKRVVHLRETCETEEAFAVAVTIVADIFLDH